MPIIIEAPLHPITQVISHNIFIFVKFVFVKISSSHHWRVPLNVYIFFIVFFDDQVSMLWFSFKYLWWCLHASKRSWYDRNPDFCFIDDEKNIFWLTITKGSEILIIMNEKIIRDNRTTRRNVFICLFEMYYDKKKMCFCYLRFFRKKLV